MELISAVVEAHVLRSKAVHKEKILHCQGFVHWENRKKINKCKRRSECIYHISIRQGAISSMIALGFEDPKLWSSRAHC